MIFEAYTKRRYETYHRYLEDVEGPNKATALFAFHTKHPEIDLEYVYLHKPGDKVPLGVYLKKGQQHTK